MHMDLPYDDPPPLAMAPPPHLADYLHLPIHPEAIPLQAGETHVPANANQRPENFPDPAERAGTEIFSGHHESYEPEVPSDIDPILLEFVRGPMDHGERTVRPSKDSDQCRQETSSAALSSNDYTATSHCSANSTAGTSLNPETLPGFAGAKPPAWSGWDVLTAVCLPAVLDARAIGADEGKAMETALDRHIQQRSQVRKDQKAAGYLSGSA